MGWIPRSGNNGIETTGWKQRGGNNGVETMGWIPQGGNHGGNDGNDRGNDGNDRGNDGNDGNDGGNHLKMTNLWMPVTSLIMVRFSIRKKVLESSWSPLPNDSRNDREMMGGNDRGKWRKRRGKQRKRQGNDGGNHLKMTNLWMPVTSLIMVQFSIRKKFWKALGVLYQMTVETTGKQWKRQGEMMETTRERRKRRGNHGLVSCWILDWECCSPWCCGFHPSGVMVSCLVLGSKLDWKCCPPWCRGFHPRGVVVSCLVHGLKLDWKFVSMVSPKWHHGVVSFSRWKQWTLTLKSCDHSFQPIRRLHSVKSHTSLEKLWDFMQKEFPFKEQSC